MLRRLIPMLALAGTLLLATITPSQVRLSGRRLIAPPESQVVTHTPATYDRRVYPVFDDTGDSLKIRLLVYNDDVTAVVWQWRKVADAARVEVGNRALRSQCTRIDLQPLAHWQADSIAVTCDLRQFVLRQTAFLYVMLPDGRYANQDQTGEAHGIPFRVGHLQVPRVIEGGHEEGPQIGES